MTLQLFPSRSLALEAPAQQVLITLERAKYRKLAVSRRKSRSDGTARVFLEKETQDGVARTERRDGLSFQA